MEGGTTASNGLGKLFSKSITSKRRRRKEKNGRASEASGQDEDTRSTSASSSQRRFNREPTLESDDANSTNVADDDVNDDVNDDVDDDVDDRSLASNEFGPDREPADL